MNGSEFIISFKRKYPSARFQEEKDLNYSNLLLWVVIIILVLNRILFFLNELKVNELFLCIDDYARYGSYLHFLHTGDIGFYRRWLPLPTIVNGFFLYLFSNKLGIADYWIILITNWIWFFLTLLVLTTGLFSRRGTTEKRRDLFSAIAFLSVVFVHQLSISTLSEPFQYFLIITFIYAMGNAWRKRNRVWRGLAVVSAMAWMSTRYEAWVTAGLIIFISAIIASRNKKWKYPFLEPIIICLVPLTWILHSYIYWGNPVYFLSTAGTWVVEYSTLLWKSILLELMKNGFLFLAVVPISIIPILVNVFKRKKVKCDEINFVHIEIFSLATGIILFGVLYSVFRSGSLGHALPPRYFFQLVIALSPFTGGVLLRGFTLFKSKRKLEYIGVIILAVLVLGWLDLFKKPHLTLLPHHQEYFKVSQISKENDLDLIVYCPERVHHAHIGRFVFQFFYSWRRVKTIVSREPADITRLSDNGQKSVVVIKGDNLKIKNIPLNLYCFETFSLIVFFPRRTIAEGGFQNSPG